MGDTPQSSINWERKFCLPVAVGLDEDDLGAQGLVMDDYLTAAGLKAVTLTGVDPGMVYKIINGKTTLLPIFSNCANLVDAAIDQAGIQSAMDRLLPAEAEFFSLDADERIAKYFAKASVILEHRHGSLLPLPYDPPFLPAYQLAENSHLDQHQHDRILCRCGYGRFRLRVLLHAGDR